MVCVEVCQEPGPAVHAALHLAPKFVHHKRGARHSVPLLGFASATAIQTLAASSERDFGALSFGLWSLVLLLQDAQRHVLVIR